jgi:ABC-type uncharacterized transport system substrate-binding protein
MANSDNPSAALEMREAEATARTLGLEGVTSEIRRSEDIAPAFDALRGRVDALYVCNDPLATTSRVRISTLASAAPLPTMFIAREYVEAEGLMSYGANFQDLYRRTAEIVDKILRGAKPADISQHWFRQRSKVAISNQGTLLQSDLVLLQHLMHVVNTMENFQPGVEPDQHSLDSQVSAARLGRSRGHHGRYRRPSR